MFVLSLFSDLYHRLLRVHHALRRLSLWLRTSSCTGGPRDTVGRILIVDDDPLLQKSLTLFFMMQGYDVEGATTARPTFESLECQRPNLIVLDFGLPILRAARCANASVRRPTSQ